MLRTLARNAYHKFNDVADAWARPDIYNRRSEERCGIIFNARTHLPIPDRFILYSLIRALKPKNILEIGSFKGGSASIMAAALEDNKGGSIIGLDPAPQFDENGKDFYGRLRLLKKGAPEGIKEAMEIAGGPFDFVFSDGPNVFKEVRRTLSALLPCLSNRATIIVDNGLHIGVNEAVRDVVASDPRLHDCGLVSTSSDVRSDPHITYLGLMMLRFDSDRISDPMPWIDKACTEAGIETKPFNQKALNHDVWFCRVFEPCEQCKLEAKN